MAISLAEFPAAVADTDKELVFSSSLVINRYLTGRRLLNIKFLIKTGAGHINYQEAPEAREQRTESIVE